MADQAELERLLPVLNSFTLKEVRIPDMPVDQALKEAEIMLAAATEDAPKFTEVGFNVALIEDLATSIGVLQFSQAQLTAALGEVKELTKKWTEQSPVVFEQRVDLLAAATYALRNLPDTAKALKKIREGNSDYDKLCDLKALAELGRKYQSHFEAINFDVASFDTATVKADELSSLYAKAFIEKNTVGLKDIRDRAFTYMRKLMGEVLEVAEYVLRKDKERMDFYYSSYRSRQRKSSKTETTNEEEVTETAEASA